MHAARRSILVQCAPAAVARTLARPEPVMDAVAELGRARPVGDGRWDVFLSVGTLHAGGRVALAEAGEAMTGDAMPGSPAGEVVLAWRSESGTRHRAAFAVAPEGPGAVITAEVAVEFAGAGTGPLLGFLARGMLGRHLEAVLERVRHRLEHDEPGALERAAATAR